MEIEVKLKEQEKSYKIYIEKGLIKSFYSKEDISWLNRNVFILSDSKVASLYLDELKVSLHNAGAVVNSYVIDQGEMSKSLSQAEDIYHVMLNLGLDRDTILLCLGGGVIGDLGGFVAATYLRGIPFIQFPTTLLAQVDSSVGGKVGVNLSEGKNLVGAFYQPKAVYIDIDVLKSLDVKQWRAGMAEVVKYGMIWDQDFFSFLEKIHKQAEISSSDLIQMIAVSCQIKAEVVSQDEKESDLRRILNFGHTYGHVIEKISGYTEVLHGEAVAIGMIAACHLAEKVHNLNDEARQRLMKLLQKIGLPTNFLTKDSEEFYKILTLDKKKKKNKIVFVLPESIGKVFFSDMASKEAVISVLREIDV